MLSDLVLGGPIADHGLQQYLPCHRKSLRRLRLESLSIMSDDGVLLGVGKLLNLRSLTLWFCRTLTNQCVNDKFFRGLSFLTEFDVSGCPFVDKCTFEHLSHVQQTALHQVAPFTSLIFFSSCITIACLQHIATLPHLEVLDLRCCQLPSDVHCLATLTTLRTLKLGFCGVKLESLAEVFLANKNTLRCLNLENNGGITDKMMVLLAPLVNLTSLNLNGCIHITDEGLEHIAHLVHLRFIGLRMCDDLTIDTANVLMNFPELEVVNIEKCLYITSNFASRLQASCPRLREVKMTKYALTDAQYEQLGAKAKDDRIRGRGPPRSAPPEQTPRLSPSMSTKATRNCNLM